MVYDKVKGCGLGSKAGLIRRGLQFRPGLRGVV